MTSQTRQKYKQTEIYDVLVDDHDIFDNYIDCFVFAASVGYSEGKYEPEDYEGQNEMLWMHFGSNDLYRAAAAAIAYQHTDDPAALTNPDKQLEVLAKYAAGGASLLEDKYGDTKGTPREGLIDYIQSQSSKEERGEQNEMLEEIARSFDDEILTND